SAAGDEKSRVERGAATGAGAGVPRARAEIGGSASSVAAQRAAAVSGSACPAAVEAARPARPAASRVSAVPADIDVEHLAAGHRQIALDGGSVTAGGALPADEGDVDARHSGGGN